MESEEWRAKSGERRVESEEWRVKSEEWRVESGEWRVESGEKYGGTFAAVAEQSGQATCRGPDCPQGCPAIRPLRIGFLSIAIRKVSGSKDVPAGGACPAPTVGEYLRPSRDRADRQRVAGRIAREGALQSGPYG